MTEKPKIYSVCIVCIVCSACSKAAANVGTLPRLAPPLFIQLPKPFAQDDDDRDDDLKHDDDDNDKDSTIIFIITFYGKCFYVDLEKVI